MSASPLLLVDRLTKSFAGVKALDDVSLEITDEHPFWGLVGPNGSGKSTLFNVVSGIYPSTDGTVWTADRRGRLGRTFQHPRVFGRLTVAENLLAVRRDLRMSEARDLADEFLRLVELTRLAHRHAGELSLGQQKLVELARTLMLQPRLVLLDEVAAGIHPRLVDRIAEHLRVLAGGGTRFLLIEHNMAFVMELCAHVFVLASGRLLTEGTPAEIQADRQVIDTYLGAVHV